MAALNAKCSNISRNEIHTVRPYESFALWRDIDLNSVSDHFFFSVLFRQSEPPTFESVVYQIDT